MPDSESARWIPSLPAPWRRWAAMVTDALVLVAVDAVLLVLGAAVCGVAPVVLFRVAAPALGLVFALVTALYFFELAGIGGVTLGSMLFRIEILGPRPGPHDLIGLCERAGRQLLHEMSIGVDALVDAMSLRPRTVRRTLAPRHSAAVDTR